MAETLPALDTDRQLSGGRAVIYLRVSTMRQATKGGEAEGYSIPAQRRACHDKASALDMEVVEEFVDAGQSAKSADRPGLQGMLSRVKKGDISALVVHKTDRLARSTEDHVGIMIALEKKGVQLISVSEVIDDTPNGRLLQSIMASFNEYYSINLSYEARKGMAEKARRGGTPGPVPIGYLNVSTTIKGTEARTVVVDEQRAGHIRWAFQAYSSGEFSITALAEELEKRGLTSRPTKKRVGKPLSQSQLHRVLSNTYYRGIVTFRGVEYAGTHEPLVDTQTFQRVQDLLAYRRHNGDRSWRHKHFLKGMTFCQRCGSKMGYGPSKGKGGETYEYFFCLGRHAKRNDCDLPYIMAESLENSIEAIWAHITCTPVFIAEVGEALRKLVTEQLKDTYSLIRAQKRRLKELETKKQKLYDADLADAIPVVELKKRQDKIDVDIVNAEALIAEAENDDSKIHERLDLVLAAMTHAVGLYRSVKDHVGKHALNRAMFERFEINVDDGDSEAAGPTIAWMNEVPSAVQQVLENPPAGVVTPVPTGSPEVGT